MLRILSGGYFTCFVLPTVFGKYFAFPLLSYIFGTIFFITLFALPKCNEYINAIVSVWKINPLVIAGLVLVILITGYASIYSVFYFLTIPLVPIWTNGAMCATTLRRLHQFDLDELNKAKYISYSEKEWMQAIETKYPEAKQYLKKTKEEKL